jgi:hypothetical protein
LHLTIYENGIKGGRATYAGNARLRACGRHIHLSLQLALRTNDPHRLTPNSAVSNFAKRARSFVPATLSRTSKVSCRERVKLEIVKNLQAGFSENIMLTGASAAVVASGRWLANARKSLQSAQKDNKSSTMLKQVKTKIAPFACRAR